MDTVSALDVTTLLRAATVEQVMRATGEDGDVLAFLTVEPGTPAARTALGRLLATTPVPLVPGCPLIVFAAGGPLDPDWRSACPPAANSLWALREFLATFYGAAAGPDPYSELEELRARAAAELTTATGRDGLPAVELDPAAVGDGEPNMSAASSDALDGLMDLPGFGFDDVRAFAAPPVPTATLLRGRLVTGARRR